MSSPIQNESADVLREVLSKNYYVHLLPVCFAKYQINMNDILEYKCSDDTLISFWNKFWFSLPDSPAIRIQPFYRICDLCTGEVEE